PPSAATHLCGRLSTPEGRKRPKSERKRDADTERRFFRRTALGYERLAAVRRAHSSVTRPVAATKAGRRADVSPRRTAVTEAARSPASVNAPSPAQVRAADQEASARLTASSPPAPSTASRTAKLRVIRVSFGVPLDRPPNRAGVTANATPIATRIAPKAPTMCLALIRAKALNVAREEVPRRTQNAAGSPGRGGAPVAGFSRCRSRPGVGGRRGGARSSTR